MSNSSDLPETAAAALRAVEEADARAAALPTPPCPSWCTERTGHAFQAGGLSDPAERVHEAVLYQAGSRSGYRFTVALTQIETAATDGADLGELTVDVRGEMSTASPRALRAAADALRAAADGLEGGQQ